MCKGSVPRETMFATGGKEGVRLWQLFGVCKSELPAQEAKHATARFNIRIPGISFALVSPSSFFPFRVEMHILFHNIVKTNNLVE